MNWRLNWSTISATVAESSTSEGIPSRKFSYSFFQVMAKRVKLDEAILQRMKNSKSIENYLQAILSN